MGKGTPELWLSCGRPVRANGQRTLTVISLQPMYFPA